MIGSIRLGNKRMGSDFKPEIGEVVIAIDRPNALGNPFRITDKYPRMAVINLFRAELASALDNAYGPMYRAVCEITDHLLAGRDVILMCHCVPLPCHGEVVIEAVKKLLEEHENEN